MRFIQGIKTTSIEPSVTHYGMAGWSWLMWRSLMTSTHQLTLGVAAEAKKGLSQINDFLWQIWAKRLAKPFWFLEPRSMLFLWLGVMHKQSHSTVWLQGTICNSNLKTGAEQYYVMGMFSLSQWSMKVIYMQTCHNYHFLDPGFHRKRQKSVIPGKFYELSTNVNS